MKLMMIVLWSSMIVGVAIADTINDVMVTISNLEKRVVILEQKLQSKEVEMNFSTSEMHNTEKERAKCDSTINAFLKEHLDIQFGDTEERFLTKSDKAELGMLRQLTNSRVFEHRLQSALGKDELFGTGLIRQIPLKKNMWYFDCAEGAFLRGKLWAVLLSVEFDKKYSEASCDLQFGKMRSNIVETLCLGNDLMLRGWVGQYAVRCVRVYRRRYDLIIADQKTYEDVIKQGKLEDEIKRSEGETLPELMN